MKVTTLFDEVEVKDKLPRSATAKLRSALLKDLNESIYKFKIRYNRVFYEKVVNFPKDITRELWLELAEKIWEEKEMEGKISIDPYSHKKVKLKLLDVTKANQ